jgi:hypothetical protein
MADDLAALIEEKQRRQGQVTGGERSVLAEPEQTSGFEEFKRAAESLLKGSTAGIISLAGGWGNVYDKLKGSKDPSALSGQGIINAIANAGGPDLMKIQGYKGLYEFGQAAAPATALSAAGLPGLFGRTAPGLAGEFAVAGGTGLGASMVAPESPLAQLALQSIPYAVKGGLTTARNAINAPSGTLPTNVDDLLRVGRMTPGEMTGSRPQLAAEARTEASTKIGETANVFRQAQAQDVTGFLDSLFQRASSLAVEPQQAANNAITAFGNYGKSLSSKLRSDSAKDFRAAKNSGGMIDTTPVLSAVEEKINSIPPETPGFEALKTSLNRIKNEYLIPATEAQVTPSMILGPTGQPASVKVTPATPAGTAEISIDRLQKNLSAWGEAVYSGKADFGKGNIFEGVAPGQAKGVALSILKGFREALDTAIDQGVPGADKLKAARDNFKNNLSKIEEYSNYPLVKYFDVPTASSLTPEDVVSKLGSVKPSERLLLADVLQNHPDGSAVWDTVRRSQFQEVLDKASKAAAGAPEGSPQIDMKVLLKELNNKKGDFGYLFPNAADSKDAMLAIEWLQKTAKAASESQKALGGDVYGATRGLGATSQQGLLLRELSSLADLILKDPKATASVVFDLSGDNIRKMYREQNWSSPQKVANMIKELSTVAAKFAPRVGPMVDTSQPTVQTQDQAQQGQDELAALLEEQARRQAGQ